MQSLLGKFYGRIKGSQEDIASEGLSYILERSEGAKLALNEIIKSDCGINLPELKYLAQNVGEKHERPDISGFDEKGTELLIIEAKFWASLTENQPLEYLKRLKKDSVLMFICPTLRVRPVYTEIIRRLKAVSLNFNENSKKHSIILSDNIQIIVKTWEQILNAVKSRLAQENNQELLSDINQLIGYCDTIDNESFLPILSEDLSPKIARRINSYYDLIDKVVDELKKRGKASTVGLTGASQRYGYTRYCKINNYGVAINLKFNIWAQEADTPFWISVDDNISKSWSMSKELKFKMKKLASRLGVQMHEDSYQDLYFALTPLTGETEDTVVDDLVQQILLLTGNSSK